MIKKKDSEFYFERLFFVKSSSDVCAVLDGLLDRGRLICCFFEMKSFRLLFITDALE